MFKVFSLIMPSLLFGQSTISPRLSSDECKYKIVAANTVDDTGGFVIPNGETHAIYRFIANGADPKGYITAVWNPGGSETIIASTKGDINNTYDTTVAANQFVGDGAKKLIIRITNDDTTQTPIIGGCLEVIKL